MSKNNHYAYGSARAAVEAVMRFSAVKRWHMVQVRGSQTLADHSACVAGLAFLVARNCPGMFFGPSIDVMAHGLVHDMPEVFTGDFPTPAKLWLDPKSLQAMEEALTPKEFILPEPDENVKMLIKLCDLADSIRFIRLHSVDKTSEHALAGLEFSLMTKCIEARAAWPDVVYYHAADIIEFYAYETRKHFAGEDQSSPEGKMEDDMARGPGNQPGGAGPVLRNVGGAVRDGVDRTEGCFGWKCPETLPTYLQDRTKSNPVD